MREEKEEGGNDGKVALLAENIPSDRRLPVGWKLRDRKGEGDGTGSRRKRPNRRSVVVAAVVAVASVADVVSGTAVAADVVVLVLLSGVAVGGGDWC